MEEPCRALLESVVPPSFECLADAEDSAPFRAPADEEEGPMVEIDRDATWKLREVLARHAAKRAGGAEQRLQQQKHQLFTWPRRRASQDEADAFVMGITPPPIHRISSRSSHYTPHLLTPQHIVACPLVGHHETLPW